MGRFQFFLIFEVENLRSREPEKLGQSRSKEAEKLGQSRIVRSSAWTKYMRASCIIITTYSSTVAEKEGREKLKSRTMVHIRLYLDALAKSMSPDGHRSSGVALCGDPRWGEKTDNGYQTEQRQRWSKDGNATSTVNFIAAVASCKSLIAVLAGE